MRIFTLPKTTRGQLIMAAIHVGMLAVALIVAWQRNGPPAEKAFWAILVYFIEIAIAGVGEIVVAIVYPSSDETADD